MGIEKRVSDIEKRNRRVELNKEWEMSLTRKMAVTVLTYATIVLFFIAAGLPKPFVNSLVPTAGFLISTASLPLLKKIWMKNKK